MSSVGWTEVMLVLVPLAVMAAMVAATVRVVSGRRGRS
jgi:hypothetical protein